MCESASINFLQRKKNTQRGFFSLSTNRTSVFPRKREIGEKDFAGFVWQNKRTGKQTAVKP